MKPDEVDRTERLRQRHVADARRALPEHLACLDWPADRIRAVRVARLRALVQVAVERSPWHRRRLAHLDPQRLTERDLATVPPMTKADLMEHFDEIVTDPRLTRALVEEHLATATGESYLFDRYHAVASSGSSGHRGVFVHDWDAWTTYYTACFRFLLRQRRDTDAHREGPVRMASVAAGRPTHMSAATFRTFSDPSRFAMHRFPVTLPREEIVAGLTAAHPEILAGYPSALHQLALEASAGRLRISPDQVVVFGEPLLPEHREALAQAWAVPVHNWWGTSEANVIGASCGRSGGLHLHDDLYVVEPVTATGAPVATGERSNGLLLTNLVNPLLPLLRYEISDEVTLLDGPCPCGSTMRRVDDIQGRAEEGFRYADGTVVHPHVFRSRLGAEPAILEYRVHQHGEGAEVEVVHTGSLDLARLGDTLTADLQRCGVTAGRVAIVPVDHLDRGATGKLQRFIPEPEGPATGTAPRATPSCTSRSTTSRSASAAGVRPPRRR
ncbi:phenylacetate--CoA ligase family protein [Actinomycetospora sp. CA-101289]|uniref:phenylacetate--CoA ligase family protein n=1 Tax=Actinomycetospora sp. CA-101289 TaxID=3239893 RepID=UPI003D997ADA